MDRNFNTMQVIVIVVVALRKESVDRNIPKIGTLRSTHVALRKESVDRNNDTSKKTQPDVALRKESVDRNPTPEPPIMIREPSLSARRAWIEMFLAVWAIEHGYVALRKESVDRNNDTSKKNATRRRSPQGERG